MKNNAVLITRLKSKYSKLETLMHKKHLKEIYK